MMISDLMEEIYLGVIANKVRSGLTMLGIVIGIASVIAMLSVGQGAEAQIEKNIQSIGSNLILVMPGAPRGAGAFISAGRGSSQTLIDADVTAILSSVQNVAAAAPELSRRYQVTAGGLNTNTSVVGTSPAYPTVRSVTIDMGSFFTDDQVTSRAEVRAWPDDTR